MALNKKDQKIDSSPKSTLQGQGKNTKYSKTSRNSATYIHKQTYLQVKNCQCITSNQREIFK